MKKNNSIAITGKTIKMLFCVSPLMSVLAILFELSLSAIPILSARIVSRIVDLFAALEENNLSRILQAVVFYIIINVGIQLLSPIRNYLFERFSDKIAKDSEVKFSEKLTTFFTIGCFEDNQFYNDMQLAKSGCGARLISALQMLCSLFKGIITIVMTTGFMLQIHWLIGLVSLLALVPNAIFNFWVSKNRVALFRSRTEPSRKLAYLSSLLSTPKYAKEVRLFHLGDYIIGKYSILFDKEFCRINHIRRKQCFLGLLAGAVSAIVNGISLYLFVMMSYRGQSSPGSIVLYLSLLPQFINGLQMLINGFAQTRENNYYIKHYFDFLEREEEALNGVKMLEEKQHIYSVEAKDLSFCYPAANRNALNGVSFSIKQSMLVAVVGENGSGKSTLMKLLMRLFDPMEGTLCYNGIPVQEYEISNLRSRMAGVFQDPARFAFPLEENITLGSVTKEKDTERLRFAVQNADIASMAEQLPKGYQTILDKQFEGGADLSGGQWQRVSLARAFYAEADILFFDEASSDLDPAAEARFYNNIRNFAKDKIAFYVTHRLSGTKDADLILVLKNGRLEESGTHAELMQRKGEYHRLYTAQASGYDMLE